MTMQTIHNVTVYDSGALEELKHLLEKAGVNKVQYEEDDWRLSFEVAPDVFVEFELDPGLKFDLSDAMAWGEDANRVADFYWRQ